MKLRFTLFFMISFLLPFSLQSQVVDDTIRSVIITEAHGGPMPYCYLELTNMGDVAVNLSNFEVGSFTATSPGLAYDQPDEYQGRLPDFWLDPDSSFLIANINDYAEKVDFPGRTPTVSGMKGLADLEVYWDEMGDGDNGGQDSISQGFWRMLTQWNGAFCVYLEYHVGGDSVVVDAIKNNINPDINRIVDNPEARSVSGVLEAWGTHILIRKTNVTQGNTNWDNSRGNSLEDSEWIPIPYRDPDSPERRFFTTVRHHGVSNVNDEFVSSDVVNIDWDNKKMIFPWGVYRDSLMDVFALKNGIAWHRYLSPNSLDSTHNIIMSGDSLTLYAVGENLEQVDFRLEQAPPTDDMALVFPKNMMILNEEVKDGSAHFFPTPFYVTEDMPVIDTIGNLDFSLRVDTLFKYIEMAPGATSEIIWVDETERVDLKMGDILRVTAKDGTTKKDYYLALDSLPDYSSNAYLSAITWPEAPSYVRLNPEWKDDTIPNFKGSNFSYKILIPYGMQNVPALVATPQNLNASIKTERAITLNGPVEARTTTFTVTAEDDSTVYQYTVLFELDKPMEFIQPFEPEPFMSQFSYREFHTNNYFEFYNPGNRPLDFSNYLITRGYAGQTPNEIIENLSTSYVKRYMRYIPGFQYQSEIEWGVNPGIIEKDLEVDPILKPGECFVISRIFSPQPNYRTRNGDCDVIFTYLQELIDNREAEDTEDTKIFKYEGAGNNVHYVTSINTPNEVFCLFKIKNDSIKSGLKGVGDPSDFELIDLWGTYDGSYWSPTTDTLTGSFYGFYRKPEFWQGNPLPGVLGSWGENDDESEWIYRDRTKLMGEGYDGMTSMFMISDGLGIHSIDPVQVYKSTISSFTYKASDGYLSPQSVKGILTDTKVLAFLDNINKEHDDQILELIGAGGIIKGDDDPVADGDTLKVTSADQQNVTKYVLSVSDEGLDADATLVAKGGSNYTITIEGSEGSISGILLGSTLNEILDNVSKPAKAVLNVIDQHNNLVPLQVRNFDSVYVETEACSNTFFEVVAEDGVTKITYQLVIEGADDLAYLFSDMYHVDQELSLVSLIPDGTSVSTLLRYLKTNEGASIVLRDKIGMERTEGDVAFDDEVIVTSPDGSIHKVYFLSFIEEDKNTEAYLLSDVFTIDQGEKTISGVPENTMFEIFTGLLIPAPNAQIEVLNDQGMVVETGKIGIGFSVRVTSGDGLKEVVYTVNSMVPVDQREVDNFQIYPNPASDYINIKGMRENSNLVISNISGVIVKMINISHMQDGSISVSDLPDGIYLIYMQTVNSVSSPVKFIKN